MLRIYDIKWKMNEKSKETWKLEDKGKKNMKSYEVTRHVKGYKIHAVFPAEVSSVEPDYKWKLRIKTDDT